MVWFIENQLFLLCHPSRGGEEEKEPPDRQAGSSHNESTLHYIRLVLLLVVMVVVVSNALCREERGERGFHGPLGPREFAGL